jgi:phosphatidylserine/phosphatidylglycerophosphate/cardiolipin synthase-like enzyme
MKKLLLQMALFCLYIPHSFSDVSTKHFIIGYPHRDKQLNNLSIATVSTPLVDPIIKGSSAHLIDTGVQTQAFFSSIHHLTSIIISIIKQAQKEILVAAFHLTENAIATELIAAHNRGVKIYIIVDDAKRKTRSSKVPKLVKAGISVCWYDCSLRQGYQKKEWCDPLMHHKCMVVDDVVITGSANATKAAQADNIENINILRDQSVVEAYRQEFARLKQLCVACK